MILTEAALRKFAKEEIINLTLDCQNNFIQELKSIRKDPSELRGKFEELKTELTANK